MFNIRSVIKEQNGFPFRKAFSIFFAALFSVLTSYVTAPAQETWTWLGGTSDVTAPENWTLSTPSGLVGPPGVASGNQFGRIASFGATGSNTLIQSSANYWLEQFVFQPDAQAYTYTATDAAGYLSFGPEGTTTVDINVIDNQSTNLQVFNFPTGGKLGFDGYIKSNAGGGDVVVNAPVLVSDGSTSSGRFSGATGSGNVYFNVDTSVHPNGNVNGGAWTSASINNNAHTNTRGRFFVDGLSGRVFLGDLGTEWRGSIHLNSNQGGTVRLTHNNSLGNQGAQGGTGTGITALYIQGGHFEVDPETAYSTTLELANNISVRRSVMFMGPRAGATIGNTPHISNISGNNTLTIGIDWNTYGTNSRTAGFIDGNWNLNSQAGTLTIAGGDDGGAIFNTVPVNVNLQLMGAGNGQIDAPILKYQSNPTLNIIKKGTGTWTLTNSNFAAFGGSSFDGGVVVEQGKLALSGAGSFADSPSIDIRSGAVLDVAAVGGYTLNSLNSLVKGAGTINGNLSASFDNSIAPGDSGTGTLNITGDLSFFGGSTLQYELSSTPGGPNDKISVVGNLNLFGTTTVNVTPLNVTLGQGTYELMSYTGTLAGDASNLTLAGTPTAGRQTFAINTSVPNKVNLDVTGAAADLTWVGGNNSDAWDVQGTVNWSGHADNRFFDGDKVTFATTGTSTPNIVGTVSPSQVNFTNGAGKNYTVSGGTLNVGSHLTVSGAGNVTFANAATSVLGNFNFTGTGNVSVTNGSFSVAGVLNHASPGTLTFSNNGSAIEVGSATLSGGTLVIDRTDDMLGVSGISTDLSGTGTFRKKGANTVELSGDNSAFAGTMIVEAGTLATRSGTALANTIVQAGATLDLNDNGTTEPGGGTAAVTIAGSGVGNLGALTVTTSGPDTTGNNAHVGSLTLSADATIRAKSPAAGSNADRTILFVDGPITGNGHNLTAIVDTSLHAGTEMDFVNNGAMNIGDLNLSGGGAFYIGGTTDLGASGVIRLGDDVLNGDPTDNTAGRLGIYGNRTETGSTVPVAKPILVTSTGGGIELYRQITGSYTMNSPITMNGNLSIDVHNGDSNTIGHLLIAGPISGAGNLDVHLAANGTQSRVGKIELTSNNLTYTGTTAVGGGGGVGNVNGANDRITLLVNGTHTGGGDYTVHNLATLGGTGSIASNVLINVGGTINPGPGDGEPSVDRAAGSGVGTLTVGSANFLTDTLNPGRLLIEYNGDSDTIDKLAVTGLLNITDALLEFQNLGTDVLNGSPKIFASYGSLMGEFLNPVGLPAEYTIDYDYLGMKQIALVGGPAGLPGDFNTDGKVDAADYVVWRKTMPGDLAKYQEWRMNFGNPPGAGSGLDGGSVPEPATSGFVLTLALGLLAWRRPVRRLA